VSHARGASHQLNLQPELLTVGSEVAVLALLKVVPMFILKASR
jgi:hypothetical protein